MLCSRLLNVVVIIFIIIDMKIGIFVLSVSCVFSMLKSFMLIVLVMISM